MIGALESPNIGEPLAKNVSIVTLAGPSGWIVGVGCITSSDSLEIPSKLKKTMTKTTAEIPAPIAKDGPCINDLRIFSDHLVFVLIGLVCPFFSY